MTAKTPDDERNSARVVGRASLIRNTGFVVAADLIFSLGRVFTFFLLARAIGLTELGRYAALLGMTQLVFPLAQWGIAHVAVRNFSLGRPFQAEWSKAVTVTVSGGLLGSAASVLIARVLFDVAPATALLISLAQLLGLGLQQAGGMAAAAHGRSGVALMINAANTAFRVAAILIFYFMISDQTVDTWARFLAVSMIGGSLATVTIVRVALDGRLRVQKPERRDLKLGSGFVFVAAANTVQADVDKVVLGGYGLLEDNGVYAAAYRVADLASLPLTALVKASYAEFFRRGSASVTESVRYARKLTAVSVSYGLAAGGLLWIAAPILKTLIGEQYEESVTVLRWIAIVPAIKAAQYFPANVLTGVDRQWLRARLMTSTAILNLLINLAFARRFGWRGAAVGTLIAEALFTCLLWLAVRRELRAEGGDVASGPTESSGP